MSAEYVSVPKVLLSEVLKDAESNSYSTQAEFSCDDADDAMYRAQREKIGQLRATAGISRDDTVVGQGFFGIALAE